MYDEKYYNNLLDNFILVNKESSILKKDSCGGEIDTFYVFENDNLKVVFADDRRCEVKRLENNNPVLNRNSQKEIYRVHGELRYILKELVKLAGMDNTNMQSYN